MTARTKKLYREESFEVFVDAMSRQTAERWVRGSWIRKREKDDPRSKPGAPQTERLITTSPIKLPHP